MEGERVMEREREGEGSFEWVRVAEMRDDR